MDFLKGIFYKLPNDKAPDFVKGSISIRREDLIETLKGSSEEWINLDCLKSKEGKGYLKVNTWKPKTNAELLGGKEVNAENIPF